MAELTKEKLQAIIRETTEEIVAPLREQQTRWMDTLLSHQRQAEAPKRDKGQGVARMVRALAATKGDPYRAADWAKRQWGEDEPVVKALAASDAAAGGFIVPPDYSEDIIELLRAQTVVRKMNPVQLPMPNGTLSIPRITAGTAGSYIGENSNIGKTEPTFGQIVLTYKKLAALVPVSNDLLRYSAPSADGIVRDDLVSALSVREDQAFIRDDGGQQTPKGLRYWAPSGNVVTANATVTLANVTSDLAKLLLKLEEANVRMLRPGWLMAPRTKQYLMTVRDGNGNYAFRDELLAGRFWGFPFGVTTSIPTNLGGGTDESELYLVDFADAVIGEATSLVIDASTEAAYHDGTNVQAAFSLDQTVIRAIAQHDFAMRHAESVAVLTAVKWIP